MNCPFCSNDDGRVIDSRASDGGASIRRRRICNKCGRRFTTYERVEDNHRLMVVKRDGRRTPFDRDKIMRSVQLACGKRPIAEDAKERIVEGVEEEIQREFDREAPSRDIGARVAMKLRDLDEIAYIRYASEYEEFKSVSDIRETIRRLEERVKDVKGQQRLLEG